MQWYYGVSLSGLIFPLTTASGTNAGPYDTQWLSGMIFKDGASSVSLGKGISGLDTGWYTISEITAAHMQCHAWTIKVTANSGCLPQSIVGTNLSGMEKILSAVSGLNTSAIISQVSSVIGAVSGLHTSGLYHATSGIPGIAASVSGLNTSAIIGNTSAIMGAVSGLHTSGLYFATSGIPGIAASVSGLNTSAIIGNTSAIIGAVSGLNTSGLYSNVSAIIGAVSGLNTSNLIAQGSSIFGSTSGIPGLATNVSNIGNVAGASVSGTLNYDVRLIRDMILPISSIIDKRYSPYRWYVALTGDGNTSSYWELADDANTTARGRIA